MSSFFPFGNFIRRRKRHSTRSRQVRPLVEDMESRLVLYSASGNVWPAAQLVTISFMPDGTNIAGHASDLYAKFNSAFGSPSVWQGMIVQAAQLWAQQANINFAVVSDDGSASGTGAYQQGDPNFGDIRFGGFNFNSTALAGASMPPPVNNYSIAGDITFNTGQSFRNGTTFDLISVAVHEIGHALGLYHSGIASAQMYATYNGVKRALTSDDILGIRSMYDGARQQDEYYGTTGNGSFAAAYNVTPMIDTTNLTALVTGADITVAGQQDYYVFTVPTQTNGTMSVTMQSSGLSLLAPKLYLYNSSGSLLATSTSSLFGDTITATYTGIAAGQTYYVRAASPLTTANGTGAYALSMKFGTAYAPDVPLPATALPNGDPLSSGGGLAVLDDVEAIVNTTTTGVQSVSSYNGHTVAMGANGSFVVVWQSQDQDGSGWGVYAKKLSPSDGKIPTEFRINVTTSGDQMNPAVAMSANGDFVVVWASANQDGSGWGIFGRRYTSLGVPIGSEFQINTTAAGDQSYPDVAMDQDGDFVVTWASAGQDGSGWGVYARGFNSSGGATTDEFRVNSTTASDQTFPSIAVKATGEFVIAWQSQNQDGSGWGVYARRYGPTGLPLGGEFRVNSTTAGNQSSPSVAVDGSGNITVVWANVNTLTSAPTINAQRYDNSGVAIGGEFQVSTLQQAFVSHPSVAADSTGNLLFTWSGYASLASPKGNILGRQYDASGVALGPEFQVNTSLGYNQLSPNVAMNDLGQVVVIWAGGGAQDATGIFMQRFTISYVNFDSVDMDRLYPFGKDPEFPHERLQALQHRRQHQIAARRAQAIARVRAWRGAEARLRFQRLHRLHRALNLGSSATTSGPTAPA